MSWQQCSAKLNDKIQLTTPLPCLQNFPSAKSSWQMIQYLPHLPTPPHRSQHHHLNPLGHTASLRGMARPHSLAISSCWVGQLLTMQYHVMKTEDNDVILGQSLRQAQRWNSLKILFTDSSFCNVKLLTLHVDIKNSYNNDERILFGFMHARKECRSITVYN